MRAEGINEASVMRVTRNRVDLKVLDVVFSVRVSEAKLFLRGPRVSRVVQENRSDKSNSDSEDMMANSATSDVGNGSGRDRKEGECQRESGGAIHGADSGETGQVLWRGNQLWDNVGEGVESDAQVTKRDAVSALPGSDGLNLELGGPVVPYKGTAADVIMYRGSHRKVRLLNGVIRSVQSPTEVLANAKRKGKGRGRPQKEGEVSIRQIAPNSPSVIADISITDSAVNCRQSAILREAKATAGLDSHTTSSVVDRLRELKVFLKQWNRESFGCIKTQIETTTALLNDLDD
ncbi:hypothetical protein V6N12_074702 [Hibiscus sabdariffa]|uniref:Uncharacterized protein n=1 Tax=Hibiscus sabdariffa TaxID=183260 RepID=A0ABR2BYA0_9ROSI